MMLLRRAQAQIAVEGGVVEEVVEEAKVSENFLLIFMSVFFRDS